MKSWPVCEMGSPGVHRRLCREKEAGDRGVSQSGGGDPIWRRHAGTEPLARRLRRSHGDGTGWHLCGGVPASGALAVGNGGRSGLSLVLADRAHGADHIAKLRAVLGQCAQLRDRSRPPLRGKCQQAWRDHYIGRSTCAVGDRSRPPAEERVSGFGGSIYVGRPTMKMALYDCTGLDSAVNPFRSATKLELTTRRHQVHSCLPSISH